MFFPETVDVYYWDYLGKTSSKTWLGCIYLVIQSTSYSWVYLGAVNRTEVVATRSRLTGRRITTLPLYRYSEEPIWNLDIQYAIICREISREIKYSPNILNSRTGGPFRYRYNFNNGTTGRILIDMRKERGAPVGLRFFFISIFFFRKIPININTNQIRNGGAQTEKPTAPRRNIHENWKLLPTNPRIFTARNDIVHVVPFPGRTQVFFREIFGVFVGYLRWISAGRRIASVSTEWTNCRPDNCTNTAATCRRDGPGPRECAPGPGEISTRVEHNKTPAFNSSRANS